MSTTTADVTKLQCVFFNKVVEQAGNSQYGIDCAETDLATEINRLYNLLTFGCYHDEFSNETLADEDTIEYCERNTHLEGEEPEGP